MSDLVQRAAAATGTARTRTGGEQWVFGIRDEVAELLTGSAYNVDSYLQAAWRVIKDSPKLTQAAQEAPETMLGAIMLGATLQLPIGGPLGQFYLTPRSEKVNGGWRTVCVPMIGYRGFFELGYRSGRVGKFDYRIVREGDHFREWADALHGNQFEWSPQEDGDDDRPLTHVIAIAKLLNGEVAFTVMSKLRIDKRKPKKTERTPWEGPHAEAMYVKTAHRELAKYQQLTVSQALAVEADENISEWNRTTENLSTVHDNGSQAQIDAAAPPEDAQEPPAHESTGEILTPQTGAQEMTEEEYAAQEAAAFAAHQASRG